MFYAIKFNLTVNDLLKVNDFNLYEIIPGDIINIPFILSDDFIYYEIERGKVYINKQHIKLKINR